MREWAERSGLEDGLHKSSVRAEITFNIARFGSVRERSITSQPLQPILSSVAFTFSYPAACCFGAKRRPHQCNGSGKCGFTQNAQFLAKVASLFERVRKVEK